VKVSRRGVRLGEKGGEGRTSESGDRIINEMSNSAII